MDLSWTNSYVFDIETDGLLDEVTKIHCVSIGKINKKGDIKVTSLTDYEDMKEFFSDDSLTKIGHNIIRYDIPVVEKLLGVTVNKNNIIDTLPLSWYLFPDREKHGLETWGTYYGIEKPPISDWKNLTIEDYTFRCSEDVKININLWQDELESLNTLYDRNEDDIKRVISHLNFKVDCINVQEDVGIKFDIDLCKNTLEKLEAEKEEKLMELTKAMPKVEVVSKKTVPKTRYKKDGTFSATWLKWVEFKAQYGIPDEYDNETSVDYVSGYDEPNPQSVSQIKSWLYSLGWVPQTFKYDRDKKTNEVKQREQVYITETGEACPSVKKLADKEPAVLLLDGLGKLKHRIGLFKGFLRDAKLQPDGTYRLYPSCSGFTNTLRLKHSVCVNMPKVGVYMGEEIRGCLIADEGKVLVGCDLSNVESKLRDHYIFPWDPEYVKEMDSPDFDSHSDLAVQAGAMSKDDYTWYVNMTKRIEKDGYHMTDDESKKYKELKSIRSIYKQVNFASVYNCGAETMSRNLGKPVSYCKELIKAYWDRNWAVKAFAGSTTVKTVKNQMWLFNPVSKMWLSLRKESDRFSTANQGAAAFSFDRLVYYLRSLGIIIRFQYHDEVLFSIDEGEEDVTRDLVQKAMNMVNEDLKLNITLRAGAVFGKDYSQCH